MGEVGKLIAFDLEGEGRFVQKMEWKAQLPYLSLTPPQVNINLITFLVRLMGVATPRITAPAGGQSRTSWNEIVKKLRPP
jgi:hypothetical protein